MINEKGYRKLIAWQKANELAVKVYACSKSFPKEEQFGLTSQFRRSALSIALNLAEGCGRQNRKEMKQFVNIALGSMAETEYLLDFSFQLGYITTPHYQQLQTVRMDAGAYLWKLHRSLL